jgi:hypothetical protein
MSGPSLFTPEKRGPWARSEFSGSALFNERNVNDQNAELD